MYASVDVCNLILIVQLFQISMSVTLEHQTAMIMLTVKTVTDRSRALVRPDILVMGHHVKVA